MKKLIAILLSAFLLVAGVGLFAGCDGRIQVSVLQYAEHGSLDNCYNGIVEGACRARLHGGEHERFPPQRKGQRFRKPDGGADHHQLYA